MTLCFILISVGVLLRRRYLCIVLLNWQVGSLLGVSCNLETYKLSFHLMAFVYMDVMILIGCAKEPLLYLSFILTSDAMNTDESLESSSLINNF